MKPPKPAHIRATRESLGMTQEQAAVLLGMRRLAWIRYENGERTMHPAFWRYWRHVAGIERIPFTRWRCARKV